MKFEGAYTLGGILERYKKDLTASTEKGKATGMFANTGVSLPTFKTPVKAVMPEDATTDFGAKLLDTDRDIPTP